MIAAPRHHRSASTSASASTSISASGSAPARRRLRAVVAAGLATALLASCASSASPAGPTTPQDPPVSQPAPTSPVTTPASTPATTGPMSTAAPTTSPPVFEMPPSEMPAAPAPLQLGASPAEQAAAIADALAVVETRLAAATATFDLAGLPLTLPDGSSVTSTVDSIGFPWAVVASVTELSSATNRVSLAQLAQMFSTVSPLSAFDHAAAADQIVTGLRAALTDTSAAGPTFLAHLVAEESRRATGTELADPAVTADQLVVSPTTAMAINAAGLRAMYAGFSEAGLLPTEPAGPAASGGLLHGSRRSAAPLGVENGCDDGMGGWGYWIGSKAMAGFTFGIEWKGIYHALTELGIEQGKLIDEARGLPKAIGAFASVGTALINAALFYTQVAGRYAIVELEGGGPLVRTKTTTHGEERTISVRIMNTDSGDAQQDEHMRRLNCVLAALGALGNNSQFALGAAADVNVTISGQKGFADRLVTANSTVLFGSTFLPVQTANSNGELRIPVLGRAQQEDKSDVTEGVQKEFSIFLEASLDPTGASQIARALADDALCLASLGTGQVVAMVAECQNAVIDIVKQFHWDLGEYSFPLTDWEEGAWMIDGYLDIYRTTMIKCGGVGGEWDLYFEASVEGAQLSGSIYGDMDEATGTGTFTVNGAAVGGGISIPLDGVLQGTFVQDSETTGTLTLTGPINGVDGGASVAVTRTTCDPDAA